MSKKSFRPVPVSKPSYPSQRDLGKRTLRDLGLVFIGSLLIEGAGCDGCHPERTAGVMAVPRLPEGMDASVVGGTPVGRVRDVSDAGPNGLDTGVVLVPEPPIPIPGTAMPPRLVPKGKGKRPRK